MRLTDQASAIWLRHELPVQRNRMVDGWEVMVRESALGFGTAGCTIVRVNDVD